MRVRFDRLISWFAVSLVLATFASSTRAEAPPEQKPAQQPAGKSNGVLKVEAIATYRIIPSAMPPSRLVCHLDRTNAAPGDLKVKSFEVEWDPQVGAGLVREVTLGTGEWQVSFWSEPVMQPDGNGKLVNAAVKLIPGTMPGTVSDRDFSVVISRLPDTREDSATGKETGRRSEAIGALEASKSESTTAPTGGGGRAFGPAVDTGIAFLDVLGTIVLRRARAALQDVIRARLAETFCKLLPGSNGKSLFPETCKLFETLRFEDLASSGRGLIKALVRDAKAALIALATENAKVAITRAVQAADVAAATRIAGGVIGVVGVVIDAAAREKTDVDPARRVVDAIGRTDWKVLLKAMGLSDNDAGSVNDVVTEAFRVASSCGSGGGCSWERLSAITETLIPTSLVGHRDAILDLASKLVASFVRGPDRTPRDMLVSAVGALAAILDLATSGEFTLKLKSILADRQDDIRNVLSLLQAISAGDIQSAMAGFASFLRAALTDPSDAALIRVGAVVGTFVGFAQADDSQPKTAEERAARREAQIAAVEGLVDFLASRNEVKGAEVIISLGGSLRWGRSFSGAGSEGERGRPGLTLGLGLDYTFNPTFGLHADISLVNLGNYLEPRAEDAPKASWSDLFEIGGTLGLFVYPKFPVYFGFNANYASHRDAVDYGLIVGVWVPLWDFL